MVSDRMDGVIGNRPRAAVVNTAMGRGFWFVLVRQEVDEFVVFGEIVSVMA